jgi:uncharacterized protein YegP (UPF0339 family)
MKLPNEPSEADVLAAAQRPELKIEWWRKGKNYWFHLEAANGEVLTPSQGYSRKKDMMATIALIKRGAASAEVVEVER